MLAASAAAVAATSALAVWSGRRARLQRRHQAYIDSRYRERVGLFAHAGTPYYRQAPGFPAVRLTTKEVRQSANVIDVVYVPSDDTPGNECALPGAMPPRRIPLADLPRFVVVFETADGCPTGLGFRFGSAIITCRHVVDAGPTFLVTARGRIAFKPQRIDVAPNHNYSGTGSDVAVCHLLSKEMSQLGVTTTTRRMFRNVLPHSIRVYGATPDGITVSKGSPSTKSPKRDKLMGLLSYGVWTERGFSGSPVMATVGGNEVIIGMHSMGDTYSDCANHGVNTHALLQFLKKSGLVEDPHLTYESINEAAAGPSQTDHVRYGEPDINFATADEEDLARTRRQMETVTKAQIDWLVSGGDTLNQANEAVLSSEDDSETPVCEPQVDHSIWDQAYDPEHLTPIKEFMTGYAAIPQETRYWSRFEGETPPCPLPRSNQLRATAEEVHSMMRRLYGGDPSALLGFKNYTYESVLEATKDQAGDPFMAFREYLECTKENLRPATSVELKSSDGKALFRKIGSTPYSGRRDRSAPQAMTQDDQDMMKSLNLKSDWVLPPTGTVAMEDSLRSQAARQKMDASFEMTMDDFCILLSRYIHKNIRSGKSLNCGIRGMIAFMDSFEDKSSAWTAKWHNLNKRDMVLRFRSQLIAITYARLALRATMWDKLPTMTPQERIMHGLADPKDNSIKNESHDTDKASAKRWRHIWASSVVDLMCQFYSSEAHNKDDIEAYQSCEDHHHTSGMGHHDEGVQRIGAAITHQFPSGHVVSDDASGWDMSVNADHLVFDATLRAVAWHAAGYDVPPEQLLGMQFATLLDAFSHLGHVLVCGSQVWQTVKHGMVPSGWLNTTATNNHIRGASSYVAGSRKFITGGDDLLSDVVLNENALRKQGVISKGHKISDWRKGEPVLYTSHEFTYDEESDSWTAKFMNLSKSVAKLLLRFPAGTARSKVEDPLRGICWAIRHNPTALETFSQIVAYRGWGSLPSKEDWAMGTWDD